MDIISFIGMVLLLTWPVCIMLLPIIVIIILIFKGKKMRNDIYPGYTEILKKIQEDKEETTSYHSEQQTIACEELPFQQLFKLGKDMSLIVDHVEMCPDETAFIRVLGERSFTPLYKRKVRRDKEGRRHIVFNGQNYYLNDKKTQPIISPK